MCLSKISLSVRLSYPRFGNMNKHVHAGVGVLSTEVFVGQDDRHDRQCRGDTVVLSLSYQTVTPTVVPSIPRYCFHR